MEEFKQKMMDPKIVVKKKVKYKWVDNGNNNKKLK